MKIAVAGGHSKKAPGARDYIDEYTEDRKVAKALVTELKNRGHSVKNCSNEKSTQSAELKEECRLANNYGADLFIAIHFNAASRTSGTRGTEVWYYRGSSKAKSYASKVSSKLASRLGLKNRGAKSTTSLYVLHHTDMTAILVEVCFVDAKGDVNAYKKLGASGVAKAIADGLFGTSSSSGSSGSSGSSSVTYTTYTVKANGGLNCRKGPGTSYAKTRALANGSSVKISKITSGWGKTDRGDYCCADYLVKKTSSSSTSSGTTYTVTAKNGLNFRKGPGTKYAKTRTLAYGKTVKIVSISNSWAKTTSGDYCSSKYLKKGSGTSYTQYKVTAKSGLNFRKGPGTSYKKTRALAYNTKFKVKSISNGWAKTDKDDYCSSKYIKKV